MNLSGKCRLVGWFLLCICSCKNIYLFAVGYITSMAHRLNFKYPYQERYLSPKKHINFKRSKVLNAEISIFSRYCNYKIEYYIYYSLSCFFLTASFYIFIYALFCFYLLIRESSLFWMLSSLF